MLALVAQQPPGRGQIGPCRLVAWVGTDKGTALKNYTGATIINAGTLLLTNMDDEELPSPMNASVVKRYYA